MTEEKLKTRYIKKALKNWSVGLFMYSCLQGYSLSKLPEWQQALPVVLCAWKYFCKWYLNINFWVPGFEFNFDIAILLNYTFFSSPLDVKVNSIWSEHTWSFQHCPDTSNSSTPVWKAKVLLFIRPASNTSSIKRQTLQTRCHLQLSGWVWCEEG